MSFFTRCFTKKSHITSPVESPMEQNESEHPKIKEEIKEVEDRKRVYNELHFSSGMDLPTHPKTIYPSNILDKELVVGQFGEPQKAQRLARTLTTARQSASS